MKKITLLAAACALFTAPAAVAQVEEVVDVQVQEVQYVEDPTQGLLFNRFKDNWFITAQGGVNVYFSHDDINRKFADRFQANAALYFGKWFHPVWGARIGADFLVIKGLGKSTTTGALLDEAVSEGLYKTNHDAVGPVFDVMANLTNLFCGYKPNRVYNFVLYMGGGGYWSLVRHYENGVRQGYKNAHDNILTFRAGIINSFNIGRNVQLFLDLRASALDGIGNDKYENRTWLDVQAYLGLNFLINNRPWTHPVVPVCPPAEDCSKIEAQYRQAVQDIAALEDEIAKLRNRKPEEKVIVKEGPLATIYFPINVATLTREDNKVLEAVANVMLANPDKKYVLTGWADTYTGNLPINTSLRERRANVVYNKLLKLGVPADQLQAVASGDVDRLYNCDGCPEGKKFVSLNRATTIQEAQ